ncbi:MAG: DUF429 domain-containing protein [Rubrivivax sp.]|nr:DUF429 domain-containing protein [Rubrivivax sp.]
MEGLPGCAAHDTGARPAGPPAKPGQRRARPTCSLAISAPGAPAAAGQARRAQVSCGAQPGLPGRRRAPTLPAGAAGPPLHDPPHHLLGVDFTCAPSRRKPITVARGSWRPGAVDVVQLAGIDLLPTLAEFERLLAAPGPWLGAFDFPFGLPRAFVQAHALGEHADAVITTLKQRCLDRMAFRALVDAWGNTRPRGQRLVHRATDTAHAATSSSPLQTRYVPVGFMYYEGLSRLVAAGVTLPGLRRGDPARAAVEGYPGRLAFELIGRRSYKNRDDGERRQARRDMLAALERGDSRLGLRLHAAPAQREALVADASGDLVDAVLCLMLAAWAARQPSQGVPAGTDVVEGWIVGPW